MSSSWDPLSQSSPLQCKQAFTHGSPCCDTNTTLLNMAAWLSSCIYKLSPSLVHQVHTSCQSVWVSGLYRQPTASPSQMVRALQSLTSVWLRDAAAVTSATVGGCREVMSAVRVVDTVVVSAVVITSAELTKPPRALSSGSACALGYPRVVTRPSLLRRPWW